MEIVILLFVAVVSLGVMYLVSYLEKRKASKMTKDALFKKCKGLIDEGKFDKLQSTLLRHPKLLLMNYNELQTTLTEYAREVESRVGNK